MKAGGGKAKGSEFERELSRFLTRWLTGQDKELCFWRSPSSGAVATINLGNRSMSGDIIAIKPEASFFCDIFHVEAKNGYPKANFHQHLKDNKNYEIKKFWLQCIDGAKEADKHGMLVFKKLGFPVIVGIGCQTKFVLSEKIKLPKSLILNFDDGTPSIAFFDMKEFFTLLTPEIVRSL